MDGMHVSPMPVKTWYQRMPIIPIIMLILLTGAWGYRWGIDTTRTVSNSGNWYASSSTSGKIIYKTDRWTGNHWYALYGTFEGVKCNGREYPYLKNGLEAEGKQIDDVQNRRDKATAIWYVLVGITLVWGAVEWKKEC